MRIAPMQKKTQKQNKTKQSKQQQQHINHMAKCQSHCDGMEFVDTTIAFSAWKQY